jgi:predicted regulator of Ras-like GTPase activity (Roadblock/LC7/MglB family)
MAIDISSLQKIDGFLAGSLVDANSGMLLSSVGENNFDIGKASAGQAEALQILSLVGIGNQLLEDVLFTLTDQYHIIRPLSSDQKIFLYVIMDRAKTNLGMARIEIKNIETEIKM